MQTRETLARGVYGGIHPCTQMEKKKTELQQTLKACILTLYFHGEWRFFTELDPDFATDGFKYTQ